VGTHVLDGRLRKDGKLCKGDGIGRGNGAGCRGWGVGENSKYWAREVGRGGWEVGCRYREEGENCRQ
jgi:hypothetical protein